MRKAVLTLLAIAMCSIGSAQNWQWGKRGGGNYYAPTGGDIPESVTNMALDRNGNVYTLAYMNPASVDVDGNSITGRGGGLDILLSSFTCNGTYRWSKVIGTNGTSDVAFGLGVDTLDGVYVTGVVENWMRTAYFGNDTSLAANAKKFFLVKYDTAGTYKWLRRPEPDSAINSFYMATHNDISPLAMHVDGGGNVHILTYLTKGAFANTYSVTSSGSHILKYDKNGAFLGGIPMDIYFNPDSPFVREITMKISPTTGKYVMTARVVTTTLYSAPLYFGTTNINKSLVIATFNTSGSLDWVRMNKYFNSSNLYGPSIDANGDIYVAGYSAPNDSLAGLGLATSSYGGPIVVKLNSSGTGLWERHGGGPAGNGATGCALLSNGEVAVAGKWGLTFKWSTASDSFVHPVNYAPDLFLTRFNGTTGTYIKTDTLASSTSGQETVTAMVADKRNSVYIGGWFNDKLTVASTTLNNKSGGDQDFFVAKYGYSNCNCIIPVSSYTHTTSVSTSQFTFTGNAVSADSIVWNYGDGTKQTVTSGFTSPVTHTYSATGSYLVCAVVYSNCGGPVYSCGLDTISCIPVVSGLTYNNTGGTTVQLTYTGTTSTLDSLIWQFGDGQTQTVYSSYTTPINHTYAATGNYNICATASSYKCGSAIDCKRDSLTCTAPAAGFAATTNAMTVQLTYNGGTTYLDSLVWDFGDGQTQKVTSAYTTPISHTFTTGGAFNICAKSYSICGNTQYCAKDTITATSVGSISTLKGVKVYPNPMNEYFVIEGAQNASAVLTNSIGQVAMRFNVNTAKQVMDISSLPAGNYILQLTDAKGNRGAMNIVKQ